MGGVNGQFTLFQPGGSSGGSAVPTFSYRSVTTTDSSSTSDYTLGLSGASFTETVYTAVGNSGKILVLCHQGTSISQFYTLATTGGQLIGGTSSNQYKLYTNGETLTIQSDGTNWIILSHNTNTAWTTYTPSIGSGFGTPTAVNGRYRRIGDTVEVMVNFTVGTASANPYSISLPSGISLDTGKLTISTNTVGSGAGPQLGNYAGNNSSCTGYVVAAAGTSTSLVYVGGNAASTTNNLIAATSTIVTTSSSAFSVHFVAPIAEFMP